MTFVPDTVTSTGSANVAITDGGYTVTPSGSVAAYARAATGQSSGKYYFEVQINKTGLSVGSGAGVGPETITPISLDLSTGPADGGYGVSFSSAYRKWYNGVAHLVDTADQPGFYNTINSPLNQFMGIAVDLDAGLYWICPVVNGANVTGVIFAPSDRSPADCTGGAPTCCYLLNKVGGLLWNSDPTSTYPLVQHDDINNVCLEVDEGDLLGYPGNGRGLPLGGTPGQLWFPTLLAANGSSYVTSFDVNFGQKAFAGTVPPGFLAGWPAFYITLPTNLRSTAITTTSITMAWDASTGTEAITYTLQYRATGSTPWTQITGISGTSQAVTGLTPGTAYDFQVEAVSADGDSGFTDTVVVTTLALPAPIPPRPLSLGRYRGLTGINWNGNVLIGDAFSGVIGNMDFGAFTEYGNPMRALVTSPPIHRNRKRVFLPGFEIDVQAGVGLSSGQGSDPVWMLDWSKDGGRTWSEQQPWRSMGKLGAYLTRLRWLQMGQSRQWILRLQSTDPVRRVIIGTYLHVHEGMG